MLGLDDARKQAEHHLFVRMQRHQAYLVNGRGAEALEEAAPVKLGMAIDKFEDALITGFNGSVSYKGGADGNTFTFQDLTCLHREYQLKDFGWCIPDYIGTLEPDDPTSPLVVVDWKLKMKVDGRSLGTTQRKFGDSWQLKHYAWAVTQHFKRKVDYVAILCIPLAPQCEAFFWTFPVNHDFLDAVWLPGARAAWECMDRINNGVMAPSMADVHYAFDEVGVCDYYDACFKCGLDTDLMKYENYVQIEERL